MADYTPKHVNAGAGVTLVHDGPGVVRGLVLSHSNAGAQLVTFYDGDGASDPVLFRVAVPAGVAPVQLKFGQGDTPRYSDGLAVDPGSCEVTVFATGGR